jgi:DtxR family Mn-dependent transcriptional regulator
MTAARATRREAALTAPVEDYLKAVYELETAGEPAETNAIAELLAIAPASVSGMMRRLSEQGLVTHERYRGSRLTTAGRRPARRPLRRHRLIEA